MINKKASPVMNRKGEDDALMLLGIDIGGTFIKYGVVRDVETLQSGQIPTDLSGPEKVADQIASLVSGLEKTYPFSAVGIGSAGRINSDTGTVTASNLHWNDAPFYDMLKRRVSLPFVLENDAQAALAAEWLYGACKGLSDALYITLGTGIGCGLLLGGRLYRGGSHVGGEAGHMITHVGGRMCACGQYGCYEQYASARALSRMAGGRTPEEVIALVKAGDTGMESIWKEYLAEVCAGLISLVWLFSPQRILLGGGLSQAGDFLVNGLKDCLNDKYGSMGSSTANRICLSKFLNGAGYLGAVALAEITFKRDETSLS
jgi:glucokinase